MANFTTKLNLKKPLQTEFYNVDDFNENCDKIDEFASRIDNPHSVTAEQVKSLKMYSSFGAMNTELGTSISVTTPIEDIITALPDNTGLKADIGASDTNIYPAIYGILTIYKIRANRVEIEFVSHVNSNHYDYNARWVGQYADNTFGGFVRVFTKEHPPTAQEVGALPISGGTLTGGLKINGGIGSFGAIEQYLSLAHVDEDTPSDYRNFTVSNPSDIVDSLYLHEVREGKEVAAYRIFGEHNKHLMGVSFIGTTKSYFGTGLNTYDGTNKIYTSEVELSFDFPVKFLFIGRRNFVPKGTGLNPDAASKEDVYNFDCSTPLNIEAMTDNKYSGKAITTKAKLNGAGYATIIVSDDRKTITITSDLADPGMNEQGEYYFYTAIG